MRFFVPADARSWIAYPDDTDFPIQNLPFGAFLLPDTDDDMQYVGVAIGDYVINLAPLEAEGLIDPCGATEGVGLWVLLSEGRDAMAAIREQIFDLLSEKNSALRDNQALRAAAVLRRDDVYMTLPAPVGNFVDFYSGINHASNVGKMFRPDQPPLLPNYRHVPVAYNGRASSVIVSEEPIRRPNGQTKGPNDEMPSFGPTKELDFELEMGFFIAEGNELGEPVHVDDAEEMMAGIVIVNDWSARDVQRWEYQPLGPFLAKSFGTSVSPWLVSLDALEQFRIAGQTQDPEVLPYLQGTGPGHFDIQLEVLLQTEKMTKPQVICRSNTKHLYWSFAQQLAHMTSNGANVLPGDLAATGTISGLAEDSFGSMLELTWRGQNPLTMVETNETRAFLADGDTVIMRAYATDGKIRIGFGEVRAQVLPAKRYP